MGILTQTKNKIRVSAGTAAVLGLSRIKQLSEPTTAYLMIGERCNNSCVFCSQSSASSADALFLSRVTWPQFDFDEVLEALKNQVEVKKIKRVCFQVVNTADSQKQALDFIKLMREKNINIKISLSTNILDFNFLKTLMSFNVECISIPLDAATEELFAKYKGYNWNKTWFVLNDASGEFPGKISTHIILGLGEEEDQAIVLFNMLHLKKINLGLFAFTPVSGTKLETKNPPNIAYYRKLQLVAYLIKADKLKNFEFVEGSFVWPEDIRHEINLDIANKNFKYKDAFRTSGCAGCNRPYYNERPGGVMYNYPRPLTDEEYIEAIGLALGSEERRVKRNKIKTNEGSGFSNKW